VIYREKVQQVELQSIVYGDVFLYENKLHILTTHTNASSPNDLLCVRLKDGISVWMHKTELVIECAINELEATPR